MPWSGWLLLAGTFALAGPSPVAVAEHRRRPASERARGPVPLRTLQVVAVCGLGCALVVLFGSGPGAATALCLSPGVWFVVARLHGRPARAPAARARALPLTLDLVAAALRAGRPFAEALALAAPAAGDPLAAELARVAGLLRLGADPNEAWAGLADDEVLAPVASTACRSAASGIRLATAFERAAAESRASRRAAALARAERAGVLAAAPLGLCFLPAFLCLGVVPVVVGIAHTALAGVG